jgi:hypothetical protein
VKDAQMNLGLNYESELAGETLLEIIHGKLSSRMLGITVTERSV